MSYINTPLSFQNTDFGIEIVRDIDERKALIDNLLELIVFTPKGSFPGDPDFGFEYWDYEYSNVFDREFNIGNSASSADKQKSKITQEACQESIRQSLATYEPQLRNVKISIELNSSDTSRKSGKRAYSRHLVIIEVSGDLEEEMGTTIPYNKKIKFHVEPSAKKAQA